MEANGYRGNRKKREKETSQRFEALRPLELAQMDILEFFINKQKVYLLLLLDDFSRFILGYRLLAETSVDELGLRISTLSPTIACLKEDSVWEDALPLFREEK